MFTGPCVIYLQDAHKHTAGPESLFRSRCRMKTISTRPLHPAGSQRRVRFWLRESVSPAFVAEWGKGKAILSFSLVSLLSDAAPVRSSPASPWLSPGEEMVQPLEREQAATLQSRISPSRTSVCILRGGMRGAVGPILLPSLHPPSQHADRGFA